MGFNGQLTTEMRGSPPRLCVQRTVTEVSDPDSGSGVSLS